VIGLTTTSPFSVRQAVFSGEIRSVLVSLEQRSVFEIMGDWLHATVDIWAASVVRIGADSNLKLEQGTLPLSISC
jgi:hypothetical protein